MPENVETDRAGAFDISRLEEVTPHDGYVTLELEVVSIEYRGEEEVRTGTLKDETDMVDFVDFDDCEEFDKLEKGETYVFQGVYLEESDRYGLQLKPNADVASVDRIGRISSADGMNQDLNESAATDGGSHEFEQLEPEVKQEIVENYGSGDTVKAPHVAGSLGKAPRAVEEVLESLATKGRVVMRHPEYQDAYKVE